MMLESYYRFTVESFGSDCPLNWDEIVDTLNDILDDRADELDDPDDVEALHDLAEEIWDQYCHDELADVPKPVFDD